MIFLWMVVVYVICGKLCPLCFFVSGHFYFDNLELAVIESESLLSGKIVREGLEEKSCCLKKVIDRAG